MERFDGARCAHALRGRTPTNRWANVHERVRATHTERTHARTLGVLNYDTFFADGHVQQQAAQRAPRSDRVQRT